MESVDESQRFSAVAREFYEPVFRFISKQSPSQADAQDLTQQTFIRAFQNFSRYDESRPFAPWIYTIARRVVADFYRQRGQTLEQLDESLSSHDPDPGQLAADRDGSDHVWALARGLQPRFHQVLLLHYKENFSLRETADIMEINITHAKVLLFRARAALKRRLGETFPYGGTIQ